MTEEINAENRLRRLEDLEAIRELFEQYAARFDRRDLVGFSQLFAENGEWHGRNFQAVGGPSGVFEVFNARFAGDPNGECHIVSNPVIELDGDRAHATSFGVVLRPGEDLTPALAMIGYYVDDVVRDHDGQWRFAVRRDYINLPPSMSAPLGPPST